MGDKTSIGWTDATWNPVRGCSRISEGCRNCYAERVAVRFSGPGMPYEGLAQHIAPRDLLDRVGGRRSGWTREVRMVPEHLADPLRWKRPRRIFVNSMSDLFHEGLTNEQIAAVFGVMAAAYWHTFQCLTKRPARMREFLTHPEVRHWISQARDAALVDHDHDPRETWKAVPGLDRYEASSHGGVRSENGALETHVNQRTGRAAVTLWNGGEPKTMPVHRLVALAHLGAPPTTDAEVCHRNGNKLDNRLSNLRWGTRSENQNEKVRHGSRGGPAKLAPEQVDEIRKRRAAGETQQVIADAFGVSRSLVSMIESGKVWAPPELPWPLDNVWLGVSVENQAAADERIPELLAAPAAVRFLSCEPLIGPVSLGRWLRSATHSFDDAPLDWVIAGCESGPGARPCEVEWLRSLRDQCAAAGVAYFLKQAVGTPGVLADGCVATWVIGADNGSKLKSGGVIELPYLDGVQHAEFPR